MKGVLIAGFITAISSIKLKKGFINTNPIDGLYYNTMTSPQLYYTSSYPQVPYYTQKVSQPIYSQPISLLKADPTATTKVQVIPSITAPTGSNQIIPTAATTTGIAQTPQPLTLTYPINAATTSYNPNFLGIQPTLVSTTLLSNPVGQQYYYTSDASQLYSPMGPTYYQSNDPSVLENNSFYEYFQ